MRRINLGGQAPQKKGKKRRGELPGEQRRVMIKYHLILPLMVTILMWLLPPSKICVSDVLRDIISY